MLLEAALLWFLAQRRLSFERSQVGKDGVVALFTACYCREPQAFELGVQFRQAESQQSYNGKGKRIVTLNRYLFWPGGCP